MSTLKKLVEECVGCTKQDLEKKVCQVFFDPTYQWRTGECWGREYNPGGKKKVVYLAGSINGHQEKQTANAWRERASRELTAAGYVVLNPLRGRKLSDQNTEAIVERDITDVIGADIILVEMDTPEMAYIGTAIEIREAYLKRKEIVLFGKANRNSHFLKYFTRGQKWFDSLEFALWHLKNVANQQKKKQKKEKIEARG